jgi:GNAT superfamily N-acetyltransferase
VNIQEALERPIERLAGVLEGARYERRDGYSFMAFPTFPIRDLNGMWVDTDAAADHIDSARTEAEALGTPFSIMVREARTPAVEAAARELGFAPTVRTPGMVVTPDELSVAERPEVQVLRVETADGLAQTLAVGAEGFGIPVDLAASVYTLEVAALEGLTYYLARVDGRDVATATGFTIGDATAIFSVATVPAERGKGYGGAVTAAAVRDGFAAGARFAALQSSAMGESVYKRLGFRELVMYILYTIPRAA